MERRNAKELQQQLLSEIDKLKGRPGTASAEVAAIR